MCSQYQWTGHCDTPAVERWAPKPKKFRLRLRHKLGAALILVALGTIYALLST